MERIKKTPVLKSLPAKMFASEENAGNFKVLPCDFLVLNGSCVVNESILTGESIPLIKDSIQNLAQSDVLDLKNKHKNNVLYAGTEVLQVYPSFQKLEFLKGKQPKDVCLGYVLRTGYDTTKGQLIRDMLFSSENLAIKQTQAFALLFVLLLFSIATAAHVLYYGMQNEDRDKNKLFLRCIIIITTVVPPELPMVLSMTVNTSLVYLR